MEHPVKHRRGAERPVPTARQTIVRMLPTCAVLVFGIPTAALALQAGTAQDDRPPWMQLLHLSVIPLMLIVYYIARAPRPRQDIEVDATRRRRALTEASQSGAVPTDPAVRKTAGVLACERIEVFAMMTAVLVGAISGVFARPELPWGFVWGPALVMSIVSAFRLRSSIAYLHALRLTPQAS